MISKSDYKEANANLKMIKKLIEVMEDGTIAVSVNSFDLTYWVGDNSSVVKLLKKERKEIKKFIKGKPNKWE